MEIINIPNKDYVDYAIIGRVRDVLANGGVIIYPTDTIYGLGVDATREDLIKRIFTIKKRSEQKPLSVICSDIGMVKKYAFVSERNRRILEAIWPGPITAILPGLFKLPEALSGRAKTVAVRIPDSDFVLALVRQFGRPITATSANISGEKTPTSGQKAIEHFREHRAALPSLVIEAGEVADSSPSAILDLSDAKPRIARVGAVKPAELMKILAM